MVDTPCKTRVLPMMSPMIGVNTWNVQVSVTETGWPMVNVPPNAGPGIGVCLSQSMSCHSVEMRVSYDAWRTGSGVVPQASGYVAA